MLFEGQNRKILPLLSLPLTEKHKDVKNVENVKPLIHYQLLNIKYY